MSKAGKSKHQLWQELCVLTSKNPDKVKHCLGCGRRVFIPPSFPSHSHVQIHSLKVEPIIRGGLRRFTDMIGQLWCSLADYFIRAGHFEKVHDVLTPSVFRVRFSFVALQAQVFMKYSQIEISVDIISSSSQGPGYL